MADTPSTPTKSGDKSSFGFLTRKIGPLPVWAYGLIAVGAYYWYTHYGPGAQKAAAAKKPAQQRPQVVIVPDQDGGHHRRPKPKPPPRGAQQAVPQPVQAVAPMTSGDIYGTTPTATMSGAVYDSGQPTAAQMGGSYVPPASP